MNQTIVEAINKRRVLNLSYHGFPRTVEPHAYGRSKAGREVLRCWQTGGGSRSGEPTGWKLMSVADMRGISDTGQGFDTPRSGYRRNDSQMTSIYAQL